MSIETEKLYAGRTQAITVSEVQSEKLVTWTRLIVGFAYLVLSLMGYLMGRVGLPAFLVGLVAIGVLFICNGYYLFRARVMPPGIVSVYALLFLDITVITVVIWVYSSSAERPFMPSTALFCAYFITIIFTALHYRASLVLFGCVMAVAQYSTFFFWNLSQYPEGQRDFVYFYFIQMAVLALVSAISIVISRNNSRTIQKVISSEMRYQNLVHRLPEMLFTMDRHGNFLWANMASQSILGVPAKVIRNRNLKDFMVEPTMLKLGSGPFRATIEVRDFEGRTRFVDCALQPAEEKNGAAAWEGIIADVTDKELAIAQREEMVGRLFQYQKMESIGSLASGMAHDFNHTLQTISDISALVQRDTAEESTRKRMDLLTEALVDARFLVSELLALGRKTPLDYRPVNLNEFFARIMPGFEDPTGKSRIKMILDIAREPLVIMGDSDYLKRVFQNLTTNARDAMPEGGTITVSCFAEKQKDGGGLVVVRFADTGTGIPQEILGRVFDPFFTTKKPGRGTGLGLALVQRIISLHNGRVIVEKTDGTGTTFRIELPQADAVKLDDDTKFILSHRMPARLLLLDDDRKIRDVLKFFLKEYGYDICEARNLDEAAAELQKYRDSCGVLVMDWKLGSDDPHRVISALRGIRKDLIVIVVSGYPADTESIDRMAITRWFTKPYDKAQLDLEIQRALHRAAK